MNENVKIALDLVLITTQMLFTGCKGHNIKAHKHEILMPLEDSLDNLKMQMLFMSERVQTL